MTPNTTGPVLLRCDVGPRTGVGHLMRCLALAEELRDRGEDRVELVREQLCSRDIPWVAPPVSPDDHRGLVARLGASLVVVDSYELPGPVYAALHDTGVPVLAIVDGPPGDRVADVYVNANLGAEGTPRGLAPGTTYLGGLDYALMRREVRAARRDTHREPDPLRPRALAFFGGTDPFGAAPVVTRAMVETRLPFEATVVAGSPALAGAVGAVAVRPGQRVTAVPPTPRLVDLVGGADVVLSAAGTSTWELMCLGVATGLVCVVDNQRPGYAAVTGHGSVLGLGELDDLRDGPSPGLARLLSDPDLRQDLRRRARRLVDGHGVERVADAALHLTTRAIAPRRAP